jgi:hypothetical protein
VIAGNPFWADSLNAFLHSLPPGPTRDTGEDAYRGDLWRPAWFGSGAEYWTHDFIADFGPLALYAAARHDRRMLAAVRWIETNVPPGGKAQLLRRMAYTDQFLDAILYFLVFDPRAPAPADPRPGRPLAWSAPGLNHLLARSCWCPAARIFTYSLSWNAIDHQRGDGNDFGFYREGEWLTKQRVGYSSSESLTDYHDSVSIQNDPPQYNSADDPRHQVWLRGDQWVTGEGAGDPVLVARSVGDGFVYALGDSTNLYNSTYERITNVVHASRSIVWLKSDRIIVYDRAETRTDGRFKRFWLQLSAAPQISANRASVRTAGGQQLFVTTLLPLGAAMSATQDESVGEPAVDEPMRYRLRIEAPGDPRAVRFLNVLQGADGGAQADPVTGVQSAAGTPFDGAIAAGTAVLFPVELHAAFAGLTVELRAGVRRILITGLRPRAGYRMTEQRSGNQVRLTVAAGGSATADSGGVLSIGT